jgi:hypothetical protein
MSQDVLSQKQKAHFAQSQAAFTAWADEHSPDEVEVAIAEINGYVADQEKQLDDQIAYQRDTARQKADKVMRHQQAMLDFCNYHPEFITGPSGDILATRAKLLMRAGGSDPEETPFTVELLEQAFRELVNEQRIDWDPKKGSPWARVEYKNNSEPGHAPEPLTEEEVDAALDSGELSLEELEVMANEQLAAQSQGVQANTEPDRNFALTRVPTHEPNAPVTRERGFAAGLFVPSINIKQ